MKEKGCVMGGGSPRQRDMSNAISRLYSKDYWGIEIKLARTRERGGESDDVSGLSKY